MIKGTHDRYSQLVREVAEETGVPLIDLDRRSQALIQKMGSEVSKLLFMHHDAGEHPNYPEGKRDDTHFNELGARKMAELVLADLKDQKVSLEERIFQMK